MTGWTLWAGTAIWRVHLSGELFGLGEFGGPRRENGGAKGMSSSVF